MRCRLAGVVATLHLLSAIGISAAYGQPGLVPNGNVETDANANDRPDQWFNSAGVSYPNDNGPSSPGTKSIQLDSAGQDWRSSTFPITPGSQYRFSFDYKFLEGATGRFRADFRFFDGGSFKGEHAPGIDVSNIGAWQTYSALVTAPAYVPDVPTFPNQADVRVSANLFGAGNGLVRFDNWSVVLVPEPSSLALLVLGCLVPLAVRQPSRGSRRA
jgi:hypothetical protein